MSRNMNGGSLFSGQRRWMLTLVVLLAMLIPAAAVFAAPPGDAGTTPPPDDSASAPSAASIDEPIIINDVSVPSNISVEIAVIDWKEDPIEEGWVIYATDPEGMAVAAKGPDLDDDGDATNMATFNSEDDGLTPGTWTFTIVYTEEDAGSIPTDLAFTPLAGNWEPVAPYKNSFEIELVANGDEPYHARFKLREIVEVIVTKIDANHKLLDDWKITATPGKNNYFASAKSGKTGDNDPGTVAFRLTPGNWTFTEAPPSDADFSYLPIMPSTGEQSLTVKSAADDGDNQPYHIRFKNAIHHSCIEVTKKDEPPAAGNDGGNYDTNPTPLAGWGISVLRADGSEADFGYTDAAGYIRFDVPPGPYRVVEEDRPGWAPGTGSSSRFDIVVYNAESCTRVDFINKQVPLGYTVEGYKLDANGHYGIPGWKITIEPLSKNGYEVDPNSALTDGLGHYAFSLPFDDYRVPGSSYRVCEETRDGWSAHTPTCYVVNIPSKPGTVEVPDFINQQVGHSESGKPDGPSKGNTNSSCRNTHTVKPGETLFGIGMGYGASPQSMLDNNSWVRARADYYLRPGDSICIP
ncbi:MAG: LysM peptidoglycan-binding domain-containing protein [Caldilineaceae bacterium]|nr:LysM peptidoglycan-binding domain-containing protein [Caldilineaceae bacterium]